MERIKIDLLPSGVMSNAYASQYDVGRTMRFVLTYQGEPYELTGAEDISLILRKPDKTEQTISLPNTSSDYVEWITDTDEIDLAGIYLAEIRIEESSVVLGSANFILKAEEDPLGGQITTLTATGNPCTFETDLADALVSLTADIVCGGGGGTPSTPIPIVGHSELNLTRCGVNLWDFESWLTREGVPHTKSGEKYTFNTNLEMYYNPWVFSDTNIPITISADLFTQTGTNARFEILDSNDTIVATLRPNNLIATGTGCKVRMDYANGGTIVIKNPFIYANSTATNFTVAFGQTVYGGVYDKSGRLTITHELVTYTGVNSEGWVMLGSGSASAYCMGISKPDCKVYSSLTSNYLESVPYDATWGNYDNFISCVSSTIYTGIRTITTVEDWKTYLSNNPLTVLYELATPIVIDVPSISVFAENGTNNITSDCIGDVDVTYIKKV